MRVAMRVALLMAAVGIALFAVVVAQPTAGATDPQLTVTGSSFAGVAIAQWQGQFNELDGGDINFTVSSSVIGLNDFCNQTVAFAASDLSYAAGQSACSPTQVPYPYQYVPDVGGSLGFEYNLKGAGGKRIRDLVLNDSTIAGIFTGTITSWNNPAIEALNPNLHLPNEPITSYYRTDPSGENYLLSDYLANTDPGPLATFQEQATVPTTPGTPSAIWADFANGIPPTLHDLVGVNGSDAASQGPASTPGGISYVETAYARNVGFPVASVVNEAGNAVQPTAGNAVEALQGATLNADLTENLSGVFDDTAGDAYPLSSYSYLVTQCSPSLAAAEQPPTTCSGDNGASMMGTAEGAELGQFIDYAVCQGQTQMAALGYAPLSEQLVEDAFAAIGRINGATEPPPPTAANCPNPTITGGTSLISAVGPLTSQATEGRTTLSVSPVTSGDAWVLAVRVANASTTVTSISGGGAGNRWTKLAQVSDATENMDVEEWLGQISNSGPIAVTVQFSRDVSTTWVRLTAQEFTNGGGASTAWAGDVAASTTNDSASSSTITYPTLSPASSGELYVGFSRASSASSAGSTPGFTYESANPNCQYVYDPGVSSSVSPTASQQDGISATVGALIEAS